VGGAWHPKQEGIRPDESFIPLTAAENVDLGEVEMANEMLECLCWDSTMQKSASYSLCQLPTAFSASTPEGMQWEMLHIIGTIMLHGGGSIRSIAFDNHKSHELIKRVLLGQTDGIDPYLLARTPFFGEIVHSSLPDHGLPRFPFRKAAFRGDFIWAVNGVCHLQKNIVCQMRSALRTIYFGNLWLDLSAARDLGLPPAAYSGHDQMSDEQAACCLNPYVLVEDTTTNARDVQIPWSLRGLLVVNVVSALASSAVLHRELAVISRCENAITAFICLDLGSMLAEQTAHAVGMPKRYFVALEIIIVSFDNNIIKVTIKRDFNNNH
jgi:hypothetical protein